MSIFGVASGVYSRFKKVRAVRTAEYSPAEVVSYWRNHSNPIIQSWATTTGDDRAPNGLELPTKPNLSTLTTVNVDTVALASSVLSNNSNVNVVLAQGVYTDAIYITGNRSNNAISLVGVTLIPPPEERAIQLLSDYNGLYVYGDRTSTYINNGITLDGGPSRAFPQNIWFENIVARGQYTDSNNSLHISGESFFIRARKVMILGCDFTFAHGCVYSAGGSGNLFVFNTKVTCPKNTTHENPARFMGSTMVVLDHVRTETKYGTVTSGGVKHGFRMHYDDLGESGVLAGGYSFVKDWRAISGGPYAQYVTGGPLETVPQSTGQVYEVAEGYPGDNPEPSTGVPYINTGIYSANHSGEVMNASLYASDMTFRSNIRTPGTEIQFADAVGVNNPPGAILNCIYAVDAPEPLWTFRD
jgi:hypothetical protein